MHRNIFGLTAQINKIIDMLDSTGERETVANETNGRANDTVFESEEMA